MSNRMKHTCCWWDSNLYCCRNTKTHSALSKTLIGDCLIVPVCEYSESCGYEKIDDNHPAWRNETDEYVKYYESRRCREESRRTR